MTVHILFVSQYFPPETCAPAVRVYGLAREWVKRGHRVTVLTAFPHHPTGIVPADYQGMAFLREEVDDIQVIRTFVYATANKGFFKRVLSYVSFMCSSVIFSPFLKFKPQVVIATSPQFLVAIAGYLISVFKRCPFVFEIRDLWPDSIIALGVLNNTFIIRLLKRVESFLYNRASLIIGVAQSTREILVGRGIPTEKIEIVPNGIDTSLYIARDRQVELDCKYGLKGKFVVSYIGTHGMAHALHHILEAAGLLRKHPDILFLFIGEGAEKENLIRYGRELKLDNVIFIEQQPHGTIPDFLDASDVSIVSLRDVDLFSHVIPSKIYEIMAAERPIVLCGRGEAKRLIEKANAGLCIDPEDPKMIKKAILQLYRDRDLGAKFGENGRHFVYKRFARSKLAVQYEQALHRLAASRRENSRC